MIRIIICLSLISCSINFKYHDSLKRLKLKGDVKEIIIEHFKVKEINQSFIESRCSLSDAKHAWNNYKIDIDDEISIIKFDKVGLEVETGNLNSNNEYITNSTSSYDFINEYVVQKVIRDNKTIEIKFKYDTIGNLIRKSYLINGNQVSYTTYEYDKKGFLTKQVLKHDFEEDIEINFSNDTIGNPIIELATRSGKFIQKSKYNYDSKNNIIQEELLDDLNNVIEVKHFEYEYDEQGNWVVKKYVINGIPLFVTKRIISYYS